ncbi:MAG: HEAT repeat domain-containing protein, partial [Acidobacteria bacterium]|nr:HEAT repeat domain-containing protein [Acidobacteriota bacterium]
RVKKALDYLLGRQQPFGGWMDPKQSFENFKTPFRETQFAVVALSSYFPMIGRAHGWDAPAPATLPTAPDRLVTALDGIWDPPPDAVLGQIETAASSEETMVRQSAIEALGRLAMPRSVPLLVRALADPSKLVQRTAAWALRQVYGAHPEAPHAQLAAALASSDARLRWGATRVFAHHFATLATQPDLVAALESLTADPVPAIRMQAVRGLWQAWFWNADTKTRGAIEDTLLAGLAKPQHPWVERNLEWAVYNLADENIRYLYNNWVPLLGRPEDRERAIQGRLAIEAQLAQKFAQVLTRGPDAQKKRLLAALADFPLRRGDVYELDPAEKKASIVVSRIGNDIEQVQFFGSSAALLAGALTPLVNSSDPEMRQLARRASLIVRETPYQQVEKAAGGRSETTVELAGELEAGPDSAGIVRAFHLPPPKNAAAHHAEAPAPSAPLDEAYFRANVEPILRRKGADGYACVNCHATHTLFDATWATVKNVVDRRDPENSLLLRKPTSTAESEGVTNARTTAHGGGQRWPKGSPEYEAILKWIEGAKLP